MIIYDKQSQEIGDTAEDNFVKACVNNGWSKPTPSNQDQNKFEHWDYMLSNGSKVDVKATKKLNRHDDESNDDIVYIEFVGIAGYGGWIYGKSDIIALERENDYILIATKKLLEVSKNLISKKYSRRPKLYMSYRRDSRPQERVGLLKIEDIIEYKLYILKKVLT